VKDAFVAEPMTVAVHDLAGGPTPGSAVNPNALYALRYFRCFLMYFRVALGNAQACLDDYVMSRASRVDLQSRHSFSDLQSTQIRLPRLPRRSYAARRIMRSTCVEAMADARRGHIAPDVAARPSGHGAHAVRHRLDACRAHDTGGPHRSSRSLGNLICVLCQSLSLRDCRSTREPRDIDIVVQTGCALPKATPEST